MFDLAQFPLATIIVLRGATAFDESASSVVRREICHSARREYDCGVVKIELLIDEVKRNVRHNFYHFPDPQGHIRTFTAVDFGRFAQQYLVAGDRYDAIKHKYWAYVTARGCQFAGFTVDDAMRCLVVDEPNSPECMFADTFDFETEVLALGKSHTGVHVSEVTSYNSPKRVGFDPSYLHPTSAYYVHEVHTVYWATTLGARNAEALVHHYQKTVRRNQGVCFWHYPWLANQPHYHFIGHGSVILAINNQWHYVTYFQSYVMGSFINFLRGRHSPIAQGFICADIPFPLSKSMSDMGKYGSILITWLYAVCHMGLPPLVANVVMDGKHAISRLINACDRFTATNAMCSKIYRAAMDDMMFMMPYVADAMDEEPQMTMIDLSDSSWAAPSP
jgi:hypothetical protein